MTNYLKPLVDQQEATMKMNDYLHSNWWKKIRQTNKLTSIEQVYVPFWCFNYEATTHAVQDGMEGRIAIEPLSQMNAILPVDYAIHTTEENLFPVQETLSKDTAKSVIYWELFAKEKRREKIDVTIKDQWLVYVPYWIGYTQNRNRTYDIIAVDALNGKVDLPMKDTVLSYLCNVDETGLG
ncbi:hypothetical protein SAMN05216353_10748 [Halobacillus alkaliphilus]|uniref:Uncharacterized protein n=1 Tax=Halobacillus alkaliphilus TaxID=396056 RepID=A0A1I2L1E6_9BACI|nr:hypothetical protein [Halobacillus alkaliphilus]SFF73132.1 hypothetical protein SAMN05216353_10748 [Halobacillus alkaliphilus]